MHNEHRLVNKIDEGQGAGNAFRDWATREIRKRRRMPLEFTGSDPDVPSPKDIPYWPFTPTEDLAGPAIKGCSQPPRAGSITPMSVLGFGMWKFGFTTNAPANHRKPRWPPGPFILVMGEVTLVLALPKVREAV